MNRLCITAALLIAGAATLLAGEACAQGRGPSLKEIRSRAPVDEAAARTAKLAELEQLLRRLQGRFRVRISSTQGTANVCFRAAGPGGPCLEWKVIDMPTQATYEGSGECNSIGEGLGSSCQFNIVTVSGVTIPDSRAPGPFPDAGKVSIVPRLVLYGLDPDLPGIRMTWVGGGTAAWEGSGSLTGNSVAIVRECRSCSGAVTMFATRDGQRIETSFMGGGYANQWGSNPAVTTVMELRRLPPDADETP